MSDSLVDPERGGILRQASLGTRSLCGIAPGSLQALDSSNLCLAYVLNSRLPSSKPLEPFEYSMYLGWGC